MLVELKDNYMERHGQYQKPGVSTFMDCIPCVIWK